VDRDNFAPLALIGKPDHAGNLGVKGVVLPAAHVGAGLERSPALPDQDRSRLDHLAAVFFHAEPPARAVPAVPPDSASSFCGHGSSPLLLRFLGAGFRFTGLGGFLGFRGLGGLIGRGLLGRRLHGGRFSLGRLGRRLFSFRLGFGLGLGLDGLGDNDRGRDDSQLFGRNNRPIGVNPGNPNLGQELTMPPGPTVLFTAFLLKNNHFIIPERLQDIRLHDRLPDNRRSDKGVFPVIDQEDFFEKNGSSGARGELFDMQLIAFLDDILFPAGFNDCKHGSFPRIEVKNPQKGA